MLCARRKYSTARSDCSSFSSYATATTSRSSRSSADGSFSLPLADSAFSYSATSGCQLSRMLARFSSASRAGCRRRALGDRARVRLPRLVGVPQLAFQLADPQQQVDALVGLLLVAELDALDLDQAGEIVVRLVDRLQDLDGRALQLAVAVRQVRLQRRARADVRRIQLQRLAVRRHRARAVLEVLLAAPRRAGTSARRPRPCRSTDRSPWSIVAASSFQRPSC